MNLVGNPMGQGHGFSCARTGHDQEMSTLIKHSLLLFGIQRIQNGVRNLPLFFSRDGGGFAEPCFFKRGSFALPGGFFRCFTKKPYLAGKGAYLGRVEEAYGAVLPVVAFLADHFVPPHSPDGLGKNRAAGLFNIL